MVVMAVKTIKWKADEGKKTERELYNGYIWLAATEPAD